MSQKEEARNCTCFHREANTVQDEQEIAKQKRGRQVPVEGMHMQKHRSMASRLV